MVSMGTLKAAAVTVVSWIVRCPVTDLVRPTAVAFCPRSTSLTRYSTVEPVPTVQVPATDPAAAAFWVPCGVAAGLPVGDSDSAAGVLPLKKWMVDKRPGHREHDEDDKGSEDAFQPV